MSRVGLRPIPRGRAARESFPGARGISFPLLADFNPKGEVARKYRVFRDGDGFSERALYVIDGDGVTRYSHVSPFVHHIPDIYELFTVLDSLKTGTPDAVEVTR